MLSATMGRGRQIRIEKTQFTEQPPEHERRDTFILRWGHERGGRTRRDQPRKLHSRLGPDGDERPAKLGPVERPLAVLNFDGTLGVHPGNTTVLRSEAA